MLTKKQRIRKLQKKMLTRILTRNMQSQPLFIFGEMRSGTNMLMNALERSWYTECYHESDDEAFDNYMLRDHEVISTLIRKSMAKVVAFKPVADSQQARSILNKHDRALGIWIYRRYQDAVNSALKNWTEHKQYLYYILNDQKAARWRAVNIDEETKELIARFYHSDLTEASARALIWYIRNRFYFLFNFDQQCNILLLNYERLVKSPASEFSRLCEFLALPDCSRLLKGIYTSSIGKFDTPLIDSEIVELCEDLFNQLENAYKLRL